MFKTLSKISARLPIPPVGNRRALRAALQHASAHKAGGEGRGSLEREMRCSSDQHREEELKPFLEGEMPPAVEQNAKACGVDAATYVTEGPGLSAYIKSDGIVYRTYVTTARGLELAMAYYGLLDRTPMGRNEEGETDFWLRRHDEYETA